MNKTELACASCGKVGSLREEVTVEADGHRPIHVYAKPDGSLMTTYGAPETDGLGLGDVIDTQSIVCDECGADFHDVESAVDGRVVEYQCETCGFWGLQDWLHDPDCGGELVEVKHPRWPIQQEVLVT